MWMALLERLLDGMIRNGTIEVVDPAGHRHVFGQGEPRAAIRLRDPSMPRRMFLDPGLALGEGYMNGEITLEAGSIYDICDIGFRNLKWGDGHWTQGLRRVARIAGRRLAQYNPVPRAKRNVAHHYDLSGTLYELFLDSDRQYSCAYFMGADDSLERAQEQKKRHLAAKLLLDRGHQVLDIGSGWGGLALYLADLSDAEVTGITLSEEQIKVAQRRALQTGLADRVRFKLQDYRLEAGSYDRIVSVGMFEHVGAPHYRAFFTKLAGLLKEDGVALLHTIGRADGPGSTHPWIRKYIFPGGYSPALSEVLPEIERAGLYVTDIEVLRLHYAETLHAWRTRFLANRTRIAELYDERFCRMWEFYLAASEATFRHAGHVVFQIQMAKRQDAVPLTRDYITDFERAHPLEQRRASAAE